MKRRRTTKARRGRDKSGVSPPFRAVKPGVEGNITVSDLMLQAASSLAFDLPSGTDFSMVCFEIGITGANDAEKAIVETVLHAIHEKHIRTLNVRKPKNVQHIARELVIDILVEKKAWNRYASIFTLCAERNDRKFFERLVRGIQRKRKSVFDKVEWFSLLNWHNWTHSPDFASPPLRYWTADAALALLEIVAHFGALPPVTLDAKVLYTKWKRLGLVQKKPSRVTAMLPVSGRVGEYKIVVSE